MGFHDIPQNTSPNCHWLEGVLIRGGSNVRRTKRFWVEREAPPGRTDEAWVDRNLGRERGGDIRISSSSETGFGTVIGEPGQWCPWMSGSVALGGGLKLGVYIVPSIMIIVMSRGAIHAIYGIRSWTDLRDEEWSVSGDSGGAEEAGTRR